MNRTVFFLFFIVLGCAEVEKEKAVVKSTEEEVSFEIDTLIELNDTRIRILQFSESERNLILLPGWKFPIEHWEDSTNWVEWARENRVNLIMPDMHKSIYQIQSYSQTRSDWQKEKSLTWLNDTLIKKLQSDFEILKTSDQVAVLGISTGGRGAVALVQRNPDLIEEVYALSGDFATTNFPNDNLYRGYFGELNENIETWTAEDYCKLDYSKNVNYHLFHAENDRIVPVNHSKLLKEWLGQNNCQVQLNLQAKGGHNYTYWNATSLRIQKDLLFLSSDH